MSWDISDQVAIVGVGTTPFGPLYRDRDPQRTTARMAVDALRVALDDAGLVKDDLDGLLTCGTPSYGQMAVQLGMNRLRFVNEVEPAGRASGLAVQWAAMAIASGMAETVALVYGNTGRSASMSYGGDSGGYAGKEAAQYDDAYGFTSPGAAVGLAWRRYQHLYGAPDGALAPVAINNRRNGALNDNAVLREPITLDDYLAAPYVTDPLRLLDYCLVNDGGVALIMTSAERARDLAKTPVLLSATAQMSDLNHQYVSEDFFFAACNDIGGRLYEQAGIAPTDIDVAQIYDNFTPAVVWSLEGFGHAPRGEGWRWIQDGRIELGGELPVNTSGGHTAEGYMQGWALHVEAVRQLRGEAGARQVPDARIAQYLCASPNASAHILRRG